MTDIEKIFFSPIENYFFVVKKAPNENFKDTITFQMFSLEPPASYLSHTAPWEFIFIFEHEIKEPILDIHFNKILPFEIEFTVITDFNIFFFKKNMSHNNDLLFTIKFDFLSHFESNLNGYQMTSSKLILIQNKQYHPLNPPLITKIPNNPQ